MKRRPVVLICATTSLLLAVAYVLLLCRAGAPMLVLPGAKPACGCHGYNLIISDHWAEDDMRTYICLGIPQ